MSWTRLPRIFRPTERAEVADELRFHVEERARELIERGMDPERAREQAESYQTITIIMVYIKWL
jgi:hypothetical protein